VNEKKKPHPNPHHRRGLCIANNKGMQLWFLPFGEVRWGKKTLIKTVSNKNITC